MEFWRTAFYATWTFVGVATIGAGAVSMVWYRKTMKDLFGNNQE